MSEPRTGDIPFPNGNRAKWVRASPGEDPRALIHALDLPRPRALILLLGGANGLAPELNARLRQLLSRGVARCAVETGALILDGGTWSGVMALMGQGVAERGYRSLLVGVAPSQLVTWPGGPSGNGAGERTPLDENHTHFVLVEGDTWGGETPTLYTLASALAEGGIPVVVVLANGGDVARQEALAAVRHHWPLVVLQGSGRLADELSTQVSRPSSDIADPVLAEILSDGDICLFPVNGSPRDLKHLLHRELREDSILKLAWQRFALYDANSTRQQRIFRRLQFWSLTLGFLGTFIALLDTQLILLRLIEEKGRVDGLLRMLIVLLAAAVTVLVAASSQFKAGTRWILLRAHAEALKKEIFRYRCRIGQRSEPRSGRFSCESRLASRMKSISRQLLQTEANLSAPRTYRGPLPPPGSLAPGDDGFSWLTPFRYVRYRLDDQLGYYRRKIDRLDRSAHRMQWLTILASGTGTVLAAMGAELWVALTTSLVTSVTAWLGYQQAESRLMKYHQSTTDLDNIKAWWSALSLEEQGRRRNFENLIDSTEFVLQAELTGWVQEMRDTLARMQARHEKKPGEAQTDKH
ncbi:DUF4231 domain-containing protein [Archangium lipolyticum]|uniref:DUF4231 domain-containing protein n=1 Tax=Archangium lipolyticum TaxID=2970465 RepID=UPI00214A5462|nr:DUF4231 domain-containing protein [Archangium lipolyticum]